MFSGGGQRKGALKTNGLRRRLLVILIIEKLRKNHKSY